MKTRRIKPKIGWLALFMIVPLITSCSSKGDSAANEVSVCATFSSTISAAEEAQGSSMELIRVLDGDETQIAPPPSDVGSVGIYQALKKEGIPYEDDLFGKDSVRVWLEVVGQCLSEDTFQYFSNYID